MYRISDSVEVSRRGLLKGTAAATAGLVFGFHWMEKAFAKAATESTSAPNAFVRIAPDNSVTVLSKHLEMGQGVYTGLATILAEELDADWEQIRVETAPADPAVYNNLNWGPVQGTGGSSSIANSYDQLRHVGAAARSMLITAAAEEWSVPATEIEAAKGILSHPGSGRSAAFGDFAAQAAQLPVPQEVTLKSPEDFSLIGKPLHRIDHASKTDGTAQFTIDVKMPGLLTAVVARPPKFGGKVKSFDPSGALAVPGVTDVVEVPRGVAVVAEHFWAAKTGREALQIDWDMSQAETRGSAELMQSYRELAERPGAVARKEGDAAKAIAGAARSFTAHFEFPYLAHAPMEPLDCVARITDGGCELWSGAQLQTVDQWTASAMLGIKPEQVVIHTQLAGGGFGRRATPDSDVTSEAVSIARAIGGRAPVKVMWTREDDIRGGRYRPLYVHRIRAGLDQDGSLVGWEHRIVGQSIVANTPFEGLIQNEIDATSVEGARNLPYHAPNMSVELHTTDVGVPPLWWRSVGSTHNAYSTEVFLDELAEAAGVDPVVYRRKLLKDHPRHLAVLNLAAEKAGWGQTAPEGVGRGIAVHESFHSYVAQVADVRLRPDGGIKVERIVCAVDCGRAINPDVIRAQMEGGIGYGLGAALHSEVTLENGEVVQSNFHDYPSLRIDEMPRVEVHIVESDAPPTGVGEPGVPPTAPAVANAYYRLTGRRLRRLPMSELLSG